MLVHYHACMLLLPHSQHVHGSVHAHHTMPITPCRCSCLPCCCSTCVCASGSVCRRWCVAMAATWHRLHRRQSAWQQSESGQMRNRNACNADCAMMHAFMQLRCVMTHACTGSTGDTDADSHASRAWRGFAWGRACKQSRIVTACMHAFLHMSEH